MTLYKGHLKGTYLPNKLTCNTEELLQNNISLQFEGGHTLIATLQCKFYSENEVEHCHWGQTLTWLEYECKVEDGSSHVDVLREKYL